jgi:hypothetical protein
MRVLTVVLALVAIPFVAGVSQEPFRDPKNCGVHLTPAQKANARGARAAADVMVHGGIHGVMDRPCAPSEPPVDEPPTDDTPPPACAVSAPAPTGSLSITGRVSEGSDPWGPLPGWCIQLTGSATGTAMTDANGNYSFTGLSNGTYTVCEVLQSGWLQTFPTALNGGTVCPGNTYGWTFTLEGFSGSFVNFRNIVAP